MKRLSNNTLAGLMICLMLTSLIGTTFVSYIAEKRATISGKVPIQQSGLVGVEVIAPTAPAGGGSGAGGGGGGGGSRGPQTHILDFTIKDMYDIHVMQDDTIITIFKNDVRYILKISKFVPSKIATLILDETSFDISPDKITSVDFNRDTLVDITIEMEEDRLIFKLYHQPKAPTKVEPIISQQTKSKPTCEFPEEPAFPPSKPFNIAFLISIIIIILLIVTYQHFRLRYVEKFQKRKLIKLASEYSKKDRNLENKQGMKVKLEKQMGLLEKSYNMKFISSDAYLKGKRRIKDMLNKL